jgi:hypothetical protein
LLDASRTCDQFLVLRWLFGWDHSSLVYTRSLTPDVSPGPGVELPGSLVLAAAECTLWGDCNTVRNWPIVGQ